METPNIQQSIPSVPLPTPPTGFPKKKLLMIILGVFILGAVAAGVYLFLNKQNQPTQTSLIPARNDQKIVDAYFQQFNTPEAQAIANSSKQAQDLTKNLISLNTEYQKTDNTVQKSIILNNMENTSKKRKELLLSLMEENPQGIPILAFDSAQKNQFPEAIRSNIEDQVNLTGELTQAIAENTTTNRLEELNYFQPNSTETFLLKIIGNYPEELGNVVEVQGVKLDDLIAATSINNASNVLGVNTDVLGDKATNWTITYLPYGTEWPAEAEIGKIQDKIKEYYNKDSYSSLTNSPPNIQDKVDLSTAPFYESQLIAGRCNYKHMLDFLQDKAVDRNIRGNIVVNLFKNSDCFGGEEKPTAVAFKEADKDGKYNVISSVLDPGIIAHELGHVRGASHSLTLECLAVNDSNEVIKVPISDLCNATGKDPYDIMGKEEDMGMMNPWQRYQSSFLAGDDFYITEASKATYVGDEKRIYNINASEQTAGSAKRGWLIWRGRPVVLEGKYYSDSAYVIEYRAGLGVTVRLIGYEGTPELLNSYLLSPPNSNNYTMKITDNKTGDSNAIVDEYAGVKIILNSINTNEASTDPLGASITVRKQAPTGLCSPALPSFEITPIVKNVKVGTDGDFTVTMRNNNKNCDSPPEVIYEPSYTLWGNVPSGVGLTPAAQNNGPVDFGTLDLPESNTAAGDPKTKTISINTSGVTLTSDRPKFFAIPIEARAEEVYPIFNETVRLGVFATTATLPPDEIDLGFIASSPDNEGQENLIAQDGTVCISKEGNTCLKGVYAGGVCVTANNPRTELTSTACQQSFGDRTCVYYQPPGTDANGNQVNSGCFVGRCISDNCTQGSASVDCSFDPQLGVHKLDSCPAGIESQALTGSCAPYSDVRVYAKPEGSIEILGSASICSNFHENIARYDFNVLNLINNQSLAGGDKFQFCAAYYMGTNVVRTECTNQYNVAGSN